MLSRKLEANLDVLMNLSVLSPIRIEKNDKLEVYQIGKIECITIPYKFVTDIQNIFKSRYQLSFMSYKHNLTQ